MTQPITRARSAPLADLWPLLAFSVGLASLYGVAQVAGELLYILECAGAVGGEPGARRPSRGV